MSSISDVLNAGFDLLRDMQQATPGTVETFVFFDGQKFPVLIDQERFSQGDEIGENGIDLHFSFHGIAGGRLPKDSERVQLGHNFASAETYRVVTAEYHPGSTSGHLLLEKRTG